MSKLRVLYITGSAGFGGVETFLRQTASGHSENVIPYYLLLNNGVLAKDLREVSGSVFIANTKFRFRNAYSFLSLVLEIRNLIKHEKIDIVHSSMAYAAIPGSIAACISNVKHVWFQHGPVSGWMDWLAGNLPCSKIIFNSNFTKQAQLKLHRLRREQLERKSVVIHLGVESPKEKVTNVVPSTFRIVMLARAQAWKGADILLDALVVASKRNSRFEADLYLAGEKDSYLLDLESKAKAIGSHVKIHPATRDIVSVYSTASCLVNASRTPEPFGLTIIEAMAHGVVPIAPNAGGPLEIVKSEENGLLFFSGDSQSLAEKIIWLMEHPKEFSGIREKARSDARDRFNLANVITKLESAYQEIKAIN